MLVLVTNDEADRTARRLALKHAAEQFHLVWLLSRGGDFTLSRPSAVQFSLYERHIDVNAWRHAVDDASDGLPVTLAKRRQPEYVSKRIHN